MRCLYLKTISAVGAIALGLGFIPGVLNAADNATVTATLTSVGALDAQNVAGMNFGTWYLNVTNPDTVTLVKSPTTGAVADTPAGAATSTEVVANTTRAQQTVAITGGGATENGTVVQVQHAAITNFGDTDAVLSAITYQTATEGPTTMTATTNYPVTIVAGATPEPVYFGGTITIDDPIPAGANTATFVVTYSY